MNRRHVTGILIGLWGLAIVYAISGFTLTLGPWPILAVAWGCAYALQKPSLRLLLVQYLTVLICTIGQAAIAPDSGPPMQWYAIMVGGYTSAWFFVPWMLPFVIFAFLIRRDTNPLKPSE